MYQGITYKCTKDFWKDQRWIGCRNVKAGNHLLEQACVSFVRHNFDSLKKLSQQLNEAYKLAVDTIAVYEALGLDKDESRKEEYEELQNIAEFSFITMGMKK